MRTENVKSRRTLKSKTQSIESSVMKLTRSKTLTIPEANNTSIASSMDNERSHTPLSRTTSLPSSFSNIERNPLPIGSDAFQAVLREFVDETTDFPEPKQKETKEYQHEEQQYQPPKKTSSLRRTQSERIPGRSVRFGGLEIEGIPSSSHGLAIRLSSTDFKI